MASPPMKPPRGVKYGRETTGCGLLVTVIKTLDASETHEERQKEKIKIEKEYQKSDKRLNELVSKHDGELTQVMHLFSQVSQQVTISREKIHTVKENLQTCKQLLRCRREELKTLWTNAVQQKYIIEMLNQINELRKIPSQVNTFIEKRHYLHASKTIMRAINTSSKSLDGVDGLKDLRNDLKTKKDHLYSKLLEELNKYLYHRSTSDMLSNFQRHNSGRNSLMSPFQRTGGRRSTERAEANSKVKKALFQMTQGFDVDKSEVIDDPELLDPDLNATYFLGIIVECFALLNKVPESIESIKVQIQNELLLIVTRTTQHMITIGYVSSNDTEKHPLLALLELIYNQFKVVAEMHQKLLKNYLSALQRYTVNTRLYELSDYWSQAQAVLQLLLTDYLDIQNMTSEDQPRNNFTENTANINSFFGRRRTQVKKTLFRFDRSTYTSANVDDGAKEHRRNLSDMSNDENLQLTPYFKYSDKKRRERMLVCDPDPSLIRKIYLPLNGYIQEIEIFMKCKSDQPCSLGAFMTDYVKETFLAKGHNRNLQMAIESLSKSHEAWRSIISAEEMKAMGLSRPLLMSTVTVANMISETRGLIQDLPSYSDELLKMVCSLLKTYRETCQAAYRGIVQPETEDKRIHSVTWLKDEDITRFLKTLPNWADLKTASNRSKISSRKLGKNGPMNSEEESPTQIQQRNIREAEMLTSNLGDGEISEQEILSDIGVLKELAILQESMEWFSNKISEYANDLKKPIINEKITISNGDGSNSVIIKEGTTKVLTNLALEFDDLANTCLLVLHLEVRVQCFHYLRGSATNKLSMSELGKGDALEPDSKVLKLTKVLSDMDDAFNSTLHPRKTKYIFEGLAHLVSRILIIASNYLENIDQASLQKMCRNASVLQHTLSGITASREVALDQAKNFYEMLYKEPDEILTTIVEKGAQFSEMQYLNALQLSCKSHGISDSNTLANYKHRLSDILGAKTLSMGVTV